MKRRFLLLALLISVLSSLVGCGPDNPRGRRAVSGEVTLDRSPLAAGTILFSPDNPRGTPSGTEIANGRYALAAHQGLVVGKYAVRIYAADENAAPVAPELPGPGIKTQPERIPARYNRQTELNVEITEEGANTFNFTLQSKP